MYSMALLVFWMEKREETIIRLCDIVVKPPQNLLGYSVEMRPLPDDLSKLFAAISDVPG